MEERLRFPISALCMIFVVIFSCSDDNENSLLSNLAEYSGIVVTDSIGTILSEDLEDWQPRIGTSLEGLVLVPAYPNPTRDRVSIRFRLYFREVVNCKIEIFEKRDNSVRVLYEGKFGPGLYEIVWSLKDRFEQPLPNGIYRVFFILTEENGTVFQTFGDIQIER